MKGEFKQLQTDTDALQAIERAQNLARDAKICTDEIEAWHQNLERMRVAKKEKRKAERAPDEATGEENDDEQIEDYTAPGYGRTRICGPHNLSCSS